MRRSSIQKMVLATACALALSGCGAPEVKTGSLTQRFTMSDAQGRQFGIVELDPVGGGTVYDVTGRVVGRITAPVMTTAAIAQ